MAEKDFEELLELFHRHHVRYCIVGAYALAFHARPRFTKDLDLLVEASLSNGKRIVEALKKFGFGTLKLTPADFSRPGRIVQLGYEPLRIDLLTAIDGCSFLEVWDHKAKGRYGKTPVWFIGRAQLIRNKEASARKQDRADLELLKSSKKKRK